MSVRLLPLLCLFLFVTPIVAQKNDPKKTRKEPTPIEGLKALQHPDENVRHRAAHTLAELGPLAKFAVPELREALKDKNAFVRIKAAEALWKIDRTPTTVLMPVLMQALKDGNPNVRAAASPVIGLLGSKAKPAVATLIGLLGDKNMNVKLAAVNALGDLGPVAKESAESLLQLAEEKDFHLIEPFVGATLASLGPDIVPTLAQSLTRDSANRRRVAAYALGSMEGAAPATDALAAALKTADPATRKLAARALGKIGPAAKQTLPALEAALADKQPAVRLEAALATWLVSGEPRHVGVLIVALGDESVEVREVACQTLGTMRTAARDAVDPLVKLLDDKELRLRAVLTLGEIGKPAQPALTRLQKLMADRDGEVALSAAFSVWQISGDAGEPLKVLTKGLESEQHDRLTIRLLGDMGEAAQSVLPTLVTLYREEEVPLYRQTLAAAIKKIDVKSAMKLGIR